MLIIFFDIKGTFHKEFVLAGQIANSAYYCDVLQRLREHFRRLHPALWRQKNWLLHYNAPSDTSFWPGNFFTKNNMTVIPHPPYLSVSLIENKTERRHFDTIEVIEAESSAVLNTLIYRDFQDAIKNGRSAGNGVYTRRVMVGSRAKVSF
jgi:hypothetical protein